MAHRLAIISTHPIQYFAPLFRLLAVREQLRIHVFFGWEGAVRGAMDREFGRVIQWDIPLLDGYEHTFVPNESTDPGTHHFFGIASRKLIPAIEDWRPDAILVFGWNYHSHLAALRTFHRRVPIFFRGDSTLLAERDATRYLRRAWLRWVYRHVDVALYVGQHNKEYFRRHGLTDSQLVWAPHAVDNDRFADPNGEHAAEALRWRREIGIDDDRAALLFAGKLDSGKAPDLLLDAFLRRQLAGADEHLLFVGSGALEDVLRRAARGARNVHFLGFQNQSRMPIVYRCGDVFALPSSRSETWGLAVNEAMASGRPVIVSDQVGCAPDLVEGRSGFVVPAGNVDAIEQALNRLFEDRSLRTRLGERASVHIQSWSLIEQARRIEHAVRHHLEGRTGPAAP